VRDAENQIVIPAYTVINATVFYEQPKWRFGIKANNLATLGFKMQQLLSQPARLRELKANARKIGRPRAAVDIVQRSMA